MTPCPKCNAKMVLKVNRTDKSTFFGCSRFPLCRGTKDIAPREKPDGEMLSPMGPKPGFCWKGPSNPRKRKPLSPEQSGRLSPAYEPHNANTAYNPTRNIFAGETVMVPIKTTRKLANSVSGVKGREERMAQE